MMRGGLPAPPEGSAYRGPIARVPSGRKIRYSACAPPRPGLGDLRIENREVVRMHRPAPIVHAADIALGPAPDLFEGRAHIVDPVLLDIEEPDRIDGLVGEQPETALAFA